MEFGDESLWLRLPPKNGKPGNTVKRLSFVLSFDDTDSSQGLEMVKDALEFLAFTMKKRETGPVGGLLLNYLKDHAEGLYRFVTERQQSTKSAEESLTNDIDAQFQGGFTINTNAQLDSATTLEPERLLVAAHPLPWDPHSLCVLVELRKKI